MPLEAKINDRLMRHLGKSRRQIFEEKANRLEEQERAVLKPLPSIYLRVEKST